MDNKNVERLYEMVCVIKQIERVQKEIKEERHWVEIKCPNSSANFSEVNFLKDDILAFMEAEKKKLEDIIEKA